MRRYAIASVAAVAVNEACDFFFLSLLTAERLAIGAEQLDHVHFYLLLLLLLEVPVPVSAVIHLFNSTFLLLLCSFLFLSFEFVNIIENRLFIVSSGVDRLDSTQLDFDGQEKKERKKRKETRKSP